MEGGVVEAVPAEEATEASLQGYLAHKKRPNPLDPPRTLGIGLR